MTGKSIKYDLNSVTIEIFIEAERQGDYITLPFEVPPHTAALNLRYRYARHSHPETKTRAGLFTGRARSMLLTWESLRLMEARRAHRVRIKPKSRSASPTLPLGIGRCL